MGLFKSSTLLHPSLLVSSSRLPVFSPLPGIHSNRDDFDDDGDDLDDEYDNDAEEDQEDAYPPDPRGKAAAAAATPRRGGVASTPDRPAGRPPVTPKTAGGAAGAKAKAPPARPGRKYPKGMDPESKARDEARKGGPGAAPPSSEGFYSDEEFGDEDEIDLDEFFDDEFSEAGRKGGLNAPPAPAPAAGRKVPPPPPLDVTGARKATVCFTHILYTYLFSFLSLCLFFVLHLFLTTQTIPPINIIAGCRRRRPLALAPGRRRRRRPRRRVGPVGGRACRAEGADPAAGGGGA